MNEKRTKITLGKRDAKLEEEVIRLAFAEYGGNVNAAGRQMMNLGLQAKAAGFLAENKRLTD